MHILDNFSIDTFVILKYCIINAKLFSYLTEVYGQKFDHLDSNLTWLVADLFLKVPWTKTPVLSNTVTLRIMS